MTDRPEQPGTRPPTDGLPKTEPLTPAQVRQNAAAKRMLRRLVQGENPPTAPLSRCSIPPGSLPEKVPNGWL